MLTDFVNTGIKAKKTSAMAFAQNTVCNVCDCVPFRMLGRFHGDHHWHASLSKSGELTAVDKDHGKTLVIQLPVKRSSLLPVKSLKKTDLGLANVISQCDNLMVVQVFCQEATRIFVCDLMKFECLAAYNRPYCPQGRLCLYECLVSRDGTRLLVKVCMAYAATYCQENASEPVHLVQISPDSGVGSKILEFSDSILYYTSAVFCPAHRNSELIVGMSCDMSGVANFTAPPSQSWEIVPYRARRQSYVLNRYRVKDDQIRTVTSTAIPLIPSTDIEMRVTRDGRYLLLSSPDMDSLVPPACRGYDRTVFVFHAETFQRLAVFNHVCAFGVCNLFKMTRSHGNLTDCLGSNLVLNQLLKSADSSRADKMFDPSALSELCRKLIINSTSPEGILTLPLPKSILDYLRFYPYLE